MSPTYSLKTAAKATVEHTALESLRRASGIEYAITLWPEWTWPICQLDKRVENRGWRLSSHMVGQRIAIHAGAHIGGRKGEPATMEGINRVIVIARGAGWTVTQDRTGTLVFSNGVSVRSLTKADIHCSAIVCTAVLASCTPPSEPKDGDGWYMGEYGFRLADVQVIEPIACAGAQGLWRLP